MIMNNGYSKPIGKVTSRQKRRGEKRKEGREKKRGGK